MLICRSRKQVWLHNPKAAGMSVGRWLTEHHGYEPVVADLNAVFDPVNHPNGVQWRHAWDVPQEFSGWEKWCIVRHPLRRWESFYNFIRRINHEASGQSFEEFTESHLSWLPPQMTYVDSCDVWIKLEHLSDGLAEMGLTWGLELLPKDNASGGQFVMWTDRTRDLVIERFRGDFRPLGYRLPPDGIYR